MYIPDTFEIKNKDEIHEFIKLNSFATVISNIDEKTVATHMPIDRLNDGQYYGHFALSNPQSSIKNTQEVLVVFTGPHTYISPTIVTSNKKH